MATRAELAAPGHKLGQVVGVLLQRVVGTALAQYALNHRLYCDCQGERPGVRAGRKVTWRDTGGNPHDLDYVLERDGAADTMGVPVAFIETAWRRYTKHSRNKSGELAGALLPLRDAFPSVRFVGVVLAGEYSAGGVRQLTSAEIDVLHVPFADIASAFRVAGLEIDYPETASPAEKAALSSALDAATGETLERIAGALWENIRGAYVGFESRLHSALAAQPSRIRLLTLYGDETVYASLQELMRELEHPETVRELDLSTPRGFEVFVEYPTGSLVKGRFDSRDELLAFVRRML